MIDDPNKLKEQLAFLDYIYPWISRKLDDLDKSNNVLHRRIVEMQVQMASYTLTIEQYKSKIQRIEQFLIEHGLIKLLGKSHDS